MCAYLTVADLFALGKQDETLNRWAELRRDFNSAKRTSAYKDNITAVVETHNELLQELVERTVDLGE